MLMKAKISVAWNKEIAILISCVVQDLTAIVGKCAGVVVMAPPHGSQEAEATIATLLSAMKPKQKVWYSLHYSILYSSSGFPLSRLGEQIQVTPAKAILIEASKIST